MSADLRIAETFADHAVVLFFRDTRERQINAQIAREVECDPRSSALYAAAYRTDVSTKPKI